MGTLIRNVRLEHNVQWRGYNYMVIHCNFQVRAADTTSRRVRVAVYFYLSNGSAMPAGLPNSPDFTATDGQAATSQIAEVTDDVSGSEDFKLYMPYIGLGRGRGHYGIVKILDAVTNRPLAQFKTESFERY
jgi:hypothetical protein